MTNMIEIGLVLMIAICGYYIVHNWQSLKEAARNHDDAFRALQYWVEELDKQLRDMKRQESTKEVKLAQRIKTEPFTVEDLKSFRSTLGISIRDFATVFSVSYASIARIEKGYHSGCWVLKYIQISKEFPEVAIMFVHRNGDSLRPKIKEALLQKLSEMRK